MERAWKVPRIWPDSIVYILGGGVSLKGENLSLIHNERVIGANDAFLLGDWVDVCWFGDARWYEWNKDKLLNFAGLKICCCPGLKAKGIKVIGRNGNRSEGITTNPYHISWNRCTGSSAINLAYLFGAKTIVLLGFDMKQTDGKDNWHDNHKIKNPSSNIPNSPYNRYLKSFIAIKQDAEKLGVKIINATVDSAITQFEKKCLEEVIGG